MNDKKPNSNEDVLKAWHNVINTLGPEKTGVIIDEIARLSPEKSTAMIPLNIAIGNAKVAEKQKKEKIAIKHKNYAILLSLVAVIISLIPEVHLWGIIQEIFIILTFQK